MNRLNRSLVAKMSLVRAVSRATLAAFAIAMLSACQKPDLMQPGFIQVDIDSSPTSLDPRFATDALSQRIGELMFDPLVRLDSQGGFTGDLAQRVERTSPTEIVFHLRHGVRFSDGRELTSRDVKYTYDFVLNPANLSPKRGGLQQLSWMEAVDDYTVKMTTHHPYAPALEMAMLDIVPYGTPARGPNTPDAPLGTGPFKLVSFERDDRVVMDRNPSRPTPAESVRGIVFKVVPDPTVRALELAEGVCDIAPNDIQAELLPYLRGKAGLNVIKSPGTTYHYLLFNFNDPRLKDLRVRRAIAYSIDRKSIIDGYLRGTARLASGLLSPENWAYDGEVTSYSYDPDRARHLLDEAGYPVGATRMRNLSFVYKTTPEGARMGEVLQAMLLRVGIEISIRTNEWATFYGDIQRGNFDLASMQWVGIRDPHHYYMAFDSKMTPTRGLNRGHYSNPEMDRLTEAGDVTIDTESRKKFYAQVQQLAADDLPIVSLWWQDNVVVMNRALEGFAPYPNGSWLSLSNLKLIAPADVAPSASE
ncbi:MAG TPA: ABC transporter substrate-binding protein [Candidatus Binataceae bacterium]|nr:ABC transporter substrate-binding protein [Candidatus Binataceae bacterium]